MSRLVAYKLMTLGTDHPRIRVGTGAESDTVTRYLTVDGVPAYQIGYGCGTCGHVLRREPGAPDGSLSASAVRDRLNTGLDGLDAEVIAAFGAQLPRDYYLVMLLDTRPTLVTPGSAGDYFAVDGPAHWQHGEHDQAIDPTNMSYYRLSQRFVADHHEFFEFVVPMVDSSHLDAATVGQYSTGSGRPTAVAFGLLDVEGPWFGKSQHWGLFHYLLDGHHKSAAAAATNATLRLLTFVSVGGSMASVDELALLPRIFPAHESTRADR